MSNLSREKNSSIIRRTSSDNATTTETCETTDDQQYTTCPYGCCKTESIARYIFQKGFLDGLYSDVTVLAFGKSYKLHKLFLERSPYFKSLFGWSTDNDSEEMDSYEVYDKTDEDKESHACTLTFDDNEECTQKSFELALARLYGSANIKEENKIPYSMIAIGQYLGINDVVCTATDYIVKQMDMSNISENLKFATSNNYGSASERMIQNGKGILCADGWEYGPAKWDDIPESVIAEIVGEDYFFVPNEWDRCIFIIRLIERRVIAAPYDKERVKLLSKVLNEKIRFCHMSPDQLQELELLRDPNGAHYINPQVLHNALWRAMQIKKLVLEAPNVPQLENIVANPAPPTEDVEWYKVPQKDDTISGLPAELNELLYSNEPSVSNNQEALKGDGNAKSTQGRHTGEQESKKQYSWTKIPSFRFSVSFANVSNLTPNRRVYAKTFWYAGSYWNLYLQKNRISSKHSFQVGVYLHRASSSSLSSPPKNGLVNPDIYADNINYKSGPIRYSANSSPETADGHVPSTNTSLLSTSIPMKVGSDSGDSSMDSTRIITSMDQNELKEHISEDPLTAFSEMSITGNYNEASPKKMSYMGRKSGKGLQAANYEDHRDSIRVYFVIFTPSRRMKPTIASFLSVPNDFSRSQSWGWKSNSMCVFNEDGTFPANHSPHLKFMIVLGNV